MGLLSEMRQITQDVLDKQAESGERDAESKKEEKKSEDKQRAARTIDRVKRDMRLNAEQGKKEVKVYEINPEEHGQDKVTFPGTRNSRRAVSLLKGVESLVADYFFKEGFDVEIRVELIPDGYGGQDRTFVIYCLW